MLEPDQIVMSNGSRSRTEPRIEWRVRLEVAKSSQLGDFNRLMTYNAVFPRAQPAVVHADGVELCDSASDCSARISFQE